MDHSKTFKILIKQIGEIEAIDAHTHIINPRLPRRCIVRRWRNNLDDTASIPAHRKAGLDIPPFPHRYVINPSPYAGSLLSDPHENRARRPLVAPLASAVQHKTHNSLSHGPMALDKHIVYYYPASEILSHVKPSFLAA